MVHTAVHPLTKLSHPFLDSSTVHRSTYRWNYRLKQLRSKLIQLRSRQVPTKIQATTKLGTCAQKTRSFHGSWVPSEMDCFMRQSLFGSIFDHHRAIAAVKNRTIDHKPQTINLNNHVTCDFSIFLWTLVHKFSWSLFETRLNVLQTSAFETVSHLSSSSHLSKGNWLQSGSKWPALGKARWVLG